MSHKSWAIVGGGMLGLTLARRLAKAGQAVTLFEAAPSLGGLASAWQLGDVTWDRHYHVTLLSDSALRSVLSELKLERELRWVNTKTGFYTDGRLYSMSNIAEFLSFPPLGIVDKARLAATILHASRLKRWQELEEMTVSEWLTRLSGRRTFEKIWLPLLRAKLGDNYRQTSAAFIWAVIARMYAARRTGLKKEMFGYVPGGYARVLERFEQVLHEDGVRIELAQPIASVQSESAQRVRIDFRSGHSERFDRVVLTTPAPIAAAVCPQLNADEVARLRGIQYQGIVCASLLLRRPLAGYYVTNITDAWVPFTAVIEMSALVDRRHFGGNSLVYLPKYLPADDPGFAVPDEQIETGFLHALERMYPSFSRDDVLCFRISRARYVLPISTLGYSKRLPPVVTSVPGVFAVNSAHIVNGTLNVNETVQLANATAAQLLAREVDAGRTTAAV
ncbi:MAG: NAD(P)/FAD-dependent oxidoreductase [Candidatus Eremiobacteraeota bacterium]|nr:NAD(P)/FAD-dependent oxidoreductase [Candidatus Eremiobacteraeota bacterium]